jgi:hypothetical protein
MLFFRSEELLEQWLAERHAHRGAILSLHEIWDLSQRWYHDRLSPAYHGRTAEQVQAIFREAGLTSEFWKLS